jgi:hypothetical protein
MLAEEQNLVYLNDDQLMQLSKEEIIENYKQLHSKYENLQLKYQQNEKNKLFEIAKLKNLILMKYVSSKEQESIVSLSDIKKPKENF